MGRDNPELTVRLVHGRNPLRVIVDSKLTISPKAKVIQNISLAPTLIATVKKSDDHRFRKLSRLGVELLSVDADVQGRVDLKKLFKLLGERKISSIMIEGGAQIITSILKKNLANRMVTVIAPKIIGKGIETVGDLNIRNLDSAKKLSIRKILKRGDDIILDSQFI